MLLDAYELVAASQRLARLKVKSFGDGTALEAPGANPRMIWIPTVDTFGPPDSLGVFGRSSETEKQVVLQGARVVVTSRFLRSAGARIHLFTDFGPSGQKEMEELINDVAMAFYEELEAPGMNFALGALEWSVRGDVSDKSIECLWSVTIGVPIWDAWPAQLLKEVAAAGSKTSTTE